MENSTSPTVRAKFTVMSRIEQYSHFNQDGKPATQHTVTLAPVYSTTGENKHFWDATPSGKLEMTLTNKDAHKWFPVGGEFYLDFIPVNSTLEQKD
jgi:hypothetical protein